MPDIPGELPAGRERLFSVDLLRGVAMAVMALDHVRDFFHRSGWWFGLDPTNLSQTYPALFATRWITHFCAPVFVFLAGTGAYLAGARGKTKSDLSKFLLKRGLFLVLLEMTVLRFGWWFEPNLLAQSVQVIWCIGWSMVALAALIWLPLWAIATFGVAMIGVHNLFDGVHARDLGSLGWLWIILHEQGLILPSQYFGMFSSYPLIPWIGVMAAGYAFGRLLLLERAARWRRLLALGGALTLAFVVLRGFNLYGDPAPWSEQKSALFTFFSFVNTTKYPPSLLFLLMTLGPAIAALALFDRPPGWLGRRLVVFGRVPLFFYVVHVYLIHALAVIFAYARYGRATWLFRLPDYPRPPVPDDYGYGLPVVYLVWIGVLLILYPACVWYAGVKKRRDGRLRYI